VHIISEETLQSPGVHFIDEAFWIVLGREASAVERRDELRDFDSGRSSALVGRLVSSPEFRVIANAWKEGRGTGRVLAEHEHGLRTLGADDRFVRLAYAVLQDREPDEEGRQYFVNALAGGGTRVDVVRTIVLSDEFQRRYWNIAPDAGVVPRDTQLCELANPAKWDNPEWMALLRDLHALPDHKLSMHRKSYELTQLLYALCRLGHLRDDTSVLSVGAGHECVLYWLANHVGRVVATDLYEGAWQSVGAKEGDERVLTAPEDYAPFDYRRDRLTFRKMDGRHLDFDSGTFDVAYSLSSIEHFGGLAGAKEAVDEMARVVRRGGVLALATEYILSGPSHEEAFQPAVHELLNRPGLRLVQPIDEAVYRRYEYAAVDLYKNPHQTPHMVVRMNETVFTTVFAVLERQ
jgi:SAM-dependent methyltransferase